MGKNSSWLVKTHAHRYINRGDIPFVLKPSVGKKITTKKPEIGNDLVKYYMQPGVCVDFSGDLENPGP